MPSNTISRLLTVQTTLKRMKQQRLDKDAKTNGVACTEPCSFPRCQHSCLHEQQEHHQKHVCSLHDYKVEQHTLQPEVPVPKPMDVRRKLLREVYEGER